ncbi:TolB-like translocation protein [Actinomadura napierensis]|uniref:Lipoprotein LpqB beta-propeller domain-containing protein n=1 Tax=Actinomadura napierensis TaxID=267854 RepID=A0ABP5LIY9_9ACTN
MTRTEDRLRDAFGAAAESIPDGSLAPVTVPSRRRRRPWAVPAAVAGALAVVVGGAALGGALPHTSRSGPAAGPGGPRHVVAIRGGRAVVEDAAAGSLTKVTALGGRYAAVAATGDRRTFFLAADAGGGSYAFYRVTLAADGTPSAPKPLPGGTVRLDSGFGKPENLAASPDGSRLAVVGTAGGRSEAVVIDVRTGGHRTWSAPGEGTVTSATWAPDNRTLGFLQAPGTVSDRAVLRLLDTGRPGSERPERRRRLRPGDPVDGDLAAGGAARPAARRLLLRQGRRVRRARPAAHRRRPGRVDGGTFTWLSRSTDYDDLAW